MKGDELLPKGSSDKNQKLVTIDGIYHVKYSVAKCCYSSTREKLLNALPVNRPTEELVNNILTCLRSIKFSFKKTSFVVLFQHFLGNKEEKEQLSQKLS